MGKLWELPLTRNESQKGREWRGSYTDAAARISADEAFDVQFWIMATERASMPGLRVATHRAGRKAALRATDSDIGSAVGAAYDTGTDLGCVP